LSGRQALGDGLNNQPLLSMNSDVEKKVFPLTHLGVLKLSGKDAAKLLQGQITCNINDVTETKSGIAAMCNPKGRAIATFILVKKADFFLLLLPVELLDTVKTKLKMYVLRSDVKIEEGSDDFCLVGLAEPSQSSPAFFTQTQESKILVNLPGTSGRKLVITDTDNAITFWTEVLDAQGYHHANEAEWRYLDIISGFPWVTAATSEEFIPQMLNLDKLGGISFNKGCYTGQEIVARTHYLGKIKRELYLAQCDVTKAPTANTAVINLGTEVQEVVGAVLQSGLNPHNPKNCKLLIVLQTAETAYNHLGLMDDDQVRLTLLPLAYD
jgi:tRNA-modifying protein YgfZ